MSKTSIVEEIDEAAFLESITKQSDRFIGFKSKEPATDGSDKNLNEFIDKELVETEKHPKQPESETAKRIPTKQRKFALEEYRQTFLQVPKIEDRKPVFVSRATRDRLDRIRGTRKQEN
jgi:hypothetical protein